MRIVLIYLYQGWVRHVDILAIPPRGFSDWSKIEEIGEIHSGKPASVGLKLKGQDKSLLVAWFMKSTPRSITQVLRISRPLRRHH